MKHPATLSNAEVLHVADSLRKHAQQMHPEAASVAMDASDQLYRMTALLGRVSHIVKNISEA